MRLNGFHISGLGLILGIILFEVWHKSSKGTW